MLYLAIDKLVLEYTLGAATVDQERHWLGIRRCHRTLVTHHAAVPRRALIVQNGHSPRPSDCDPVPDPLALDRVVRHGPAVYHDLGIVCPASLANVDRALDVRAETGDGVVVNADVGVVALPGIVIDEIDP